MKTPALIQCPACTNKVSAEAAACPHCGHAVAKKSSITLRTIFLLVAALGLLLLAEFVGSKREADRLRVERSHR